MPTVPVEVALAHLDSLGFDGVELTVIPGYSTEIGRLDAAERRRIRKLLDEHRLALPAIAAHVDMLPDDASLVAANLEHLRRSVDLALDLAGPEGPPAINTTAGGHSGAGDEWRQPLLDRLGSLVEYAAARGVMVAIEPHVSTVLNNPQVVKDLVEEINSPHLRVNFDISHFNVQGMSIEETVPLLAPLSIHTHVKDERGVVPDFQFLIPGEGEFDYVCYLRAMQAAGYDGFITVEVSIMVQRRPDYDPLSAATQSYDVLSHAFAEAGIERPAR
jgi:inosose dehydratase